MTWDMYPDGTTVHADPNSRLGQNLVNILIFKGLDPFSRMTVIQNRMVEQEVDLMEPPRRIPKVVLSLPNGEVIETEPIALSPAS